MNRRQKWIVTWLMVLVVILALDALRAEPLTAEQAEQRLEQQMSSAIQPPMQGWKRDQVAATTSMALDWYSTKRGFDRCDTCAEGNPLYSWADRDTTQLLAAMLSTRVLFAWMERRSYKRSLPGWARALAMIETGTHMAAVGWNEGRD